MEVAKKTLNNWGRRGLLRGEDLAEFDKATWKQVVDNLQCPGGQTKNQVKNANKDSTILQYPFVFGAKAQKRLLETLKLMRVTALATRPAPVHAKDLSYGKEYASIEDKLVALAIHTYALYREDNAGVYFSLEEAMRGTVYTSSLKPFQQVNNGKGALVSIKQQLVGADKWQAELSL
eukprot:6325074-Ditylum_brightwellii.AAC.1